MNDRPLKVCLISSSYLPNEGGAEIGLHNIALNLIKKNHNPIVVTSFTHKYNLSKKRIILPYKVIGLPPKFFHSIEMFTSFSFFSNFIYNILQKRFNFDFWHATFGFPTGISVIRFCNKYKIPYSVRCVGEDIQLEKSIDYGMRKKNKIDKSIKKWLPKADCLIATTSTVESEYKKLGVSPRNIIKIPNGIDLDRIKMIKKLNSKKLKKKKIIFLALGRYHPKKNFENLLEASILLKKNIDTNFEVRIVGNGVKILLNKLLPEYQKFIRIFDTSNTKKTLNFPSDQIYKYYNNSDIFVMPSIIESFGIVTLEAMSFGLPVIAANSPGTKDLTENGKFALTYNGKASQLSKLMQKMLTNKYLREKYSKLSLKKSKSFDWKLITDKYIQLYKKRSNFLSK